MARAITLLVCPLALLACDGGASSPPTAAAGMDGSTATDTPGVSGDGGADGDVGAGGDVGDGGNGGVVRLGVPGGVLVAGPDGRFGIEGAGGLPAVTGARGDVLLVVAGNRVTLATGACVVAAPTAMELPTEVAPGGLDAMGPLVTLRLQCEPAPEAGLDVYLQGHAGRAGITARMRVRAHRDVTVLRAAPLAVDGDGALYLAGPVADDRVLDNGSLVAADATVRLSAGDRGRDPLAGVFPWPLRGNMVANTDLGVLDLGTGHGLAAGFLTTVHGMTEVGLGANGIAPPRTDGAGGYDVFTADVHYLPNGTPVAAGGSLWTEVFWLDPWATSGITGLESYADAVRDHLGITPWQRRPPRAGRAEGGNGEGRHVPSAWQSWCLGYQGGYGHDVDSAVLRQNVDAGARDLVPYGLEMVPLDDGWQVAWGDWTPRPDAFPMGWGGEVAYARDHGVSGGFWVAPFTVDRTSATARAHPDWLAALQPALGALVVPGGRAVLDLSRDDTVAFVRATAHAVNATGPGWSKQDYTYQALATVPSVPSVTSLEAFRRGWAAVRAETPGDTLLLSVAEFGPNFGVADAVRTGLDNGGRWDEHPGDPDAALASTRAFKATARTATRRWYLDDRVVLLDPDAIPFRPMDTPPTIGDTEERTFSVLVGLLGGLVELGDPLVGMRPFAQDTLRRLLPVYGHPARPLDVFVRDYNERWVLPVTPWSLDPAAPLPWTLAAVTHWGSNRDLSVAPPAGMPDAPRTYVFTRAELGLGDAPLVAWELWSDAVLPVDDHGVSVTVAAHESALVAVRPRRAGVQVLGTDRHITAGAPDVVSETWDGTTVRVRLRVVAVRGGGRTMPVRVTLRADATVTGTPMATLEGATATDLTAARDGERVTVRWTPTATGEAVLAVRFGR